MVFGILPLEYDYHLIVTGDSVVAVNFDDSVEAGSGLAVTGWTYGVSDDIAGLILLECDI